MAIRRQRGAFTLIEALVAISFAALAGSALILGTTASVQSTQDCQEQTIALAMAQQLMDEVMGAGYVSDSGDPYAALQPDGHERSGLSRHLFDDIGDFNGYRSQPPTDAWGIPLGTENGQGGLRNSNFQVPPGLFDNWRQEVEVRIVAIDPTGKTRELAKLRRIVAYVPPLP
jgi:type II secretory pathway pseudopilin PulG